MKRILFCVVALSFLAAMAGARQPAPIAGSDGAAGYIERLQILKQYDAYGGASFPDVGPYEVIVGIAHGKLVPDSPENAGIVDLKLAPKDAEGMVDYSEDFVILRPKSAEHAKRILFYDVVNRGHKVALSVFDRGGSTFAAGQQGNALLLRLGYTLVWSGDLVYQSRASRGAFDLLIRARRRSLVFRSSAAP